MTLRPYQQRAIELLRDAYRSGKRAPLLVAPTGSGKTRMSVAIASSHISKRGSVLALAHRTELISQLADALRADGLPEVGVIQSGTENPHPIAPVQVASIQTLIARKQLPGASLVILDEARHYLAESWGTVAGHYAGAVRLGLDATPERGDGKPMGDLFDALIAPTSVAELTQQGYLVPADTIAPKRYDPSRLVGDPIQQWGKHAAGMLTFAFCVSVPAADELAERFSAAGIPAASVTGETPSDSRSTRLADFAAGKLRVLTNVNCLVEGTDIPAAQCCMVLRGFGTAGGLIQAMGRVLRPYPGKERALVLDLVGATRRYGVPADPRTYSLEGRAITWTGLPKRKPMHLRQAYGALSRVSGEQRDYLNEQLLIAQDRGYKPGWAMVQFKAKFGHAPGGKA